MNDHHEIEIDEEIEESIQDTVDDTPINNPSETHTQISETSFLLDFRTSVRSK